MSHDNPQEPDNATGQQSRRERVQDAAEQVRTAAGQVRQRAERVVAKPGEALEKAKKMKKGADQLNKGWKVAKPYITAAKEGKAEINAYGLELGLWSEPLESDEPAKTHEERAAEMAEVAVEWAKWGMEWAAWGAGWFNAGQEAVTTACDTAAAVAGAVMDPIGTVRYVQEVATDAVDGAMCFDVDDVYEDAEYEAAEQAEEDSDYVLVGSEDIDVSQQDAEAQNPNKDMSQWDQFMLALSILVDKIRSGLSKVWNRDQSNGSVTENTATMPVMPGSDLDQESHNATEENALASSATSGNTNDHDEDPEFRMSNNR